MRRLLISDYNVNDNREEFLDDLSQKLYDIIEYAELDGFEPRCSVIEIDEDTEIICSGFVFDLNGENKLVSLYINTDATYMPFYDNDSGFFSGWVYKMKSATSSLDEGQEVNGLKEIDLFELLIYGVLDC